MLSFRFVCNCNGRRIKIEDENGHILADKSHVP